MYRGNFRILIFIDLLATALGSSIILMMILSVNKGKAAGVAGNPRSFIYDRVFADNDPNALFKVIVKSGDTNEWLESDIPEIAEKTPGIFLMEPQPKKQIHIWGPVNQYDSLGKFAGQVYNVYSTAKKPGKWIVGILYYNNKDIAKLQTGQLSTPISITHILRIDGKDTTIHKEVSLGNYSYISFTVDAN
jgi:hypothetical protein